MSKDFDIVKMFNDGFPEFLTNRYGLDLAEPPKRFFAANTDIYTNEKEMVIESELPGIKKEDIGINIDNGMLFVKVGSDEKTEEKERNYIVKKRRAVQSEMSFYLPRKADHEKINAEFENGILKITVPFVESKDLKKIEIK